MKDYIRMIIGLILVVIIHLLLSDFVFSQRKLLKSDDGCNIWYAGSTIKVMKYDNAPDEYGKIELYAAKNEYESFQIVLNSKREIDKMNVFVSDLMNETGNKIGKENIFIKKVEYVKVTKPTDDYGKKDYYPDPLPPVTSAFKVYPSINTPVWITIRIPENTSAGAYTGKIIMVSGELKYDIPFKITVWNFSIPIKSSVRSCFGFSTHLLKKYHNLESDDELKAVVDKYYNEFRNYRIAPMNPFELYPVKINITGIEWEGGAFIKDPKLNKEVYKVTDDDENLTVEAKYKKKITIKPGAKYKIVWQARGDSDASQYTVQMNCYNHFGQYIPYENIVKVAAANTNWARDSIDDISFCNDAESVSLILVPTKRAKYGYRKGSVCFSEIQLIDKKSEQKLLDQGDFKVDIDKIKVELDFTQFDLAGKRYLDEFGFNSFNLNLQGMGSGTFYARVPGNFAGFPQGTPEYDKLMTGYLTQLENHLQQKGWLGKEYVYWFDEPDAKDYPFVREGMEIIRKNAPRLTRFITEHAPGPDIMDVSEISCIVLHRLDKDEITKLEKKGREFWSYLCTQPKHPWISLFIDHDAINLRAWLWLTYSYKLKGILIWNTNYWNSDEASPPEMLQNPWEDPMSYMTYYWTAYEEVLPWGNGDGRFFYPPNRNPNVDKKKYLDPPVVSQRLEILRDGLEDYEYFLILQNLIQKTKKHEEYKNLLEIPENILKNGKEYSKDPLLMLDHRMKLGDAIEKLIKSK